jgi:hypothetical protein
MGIGTVKSAAHGQDQRNPDVRSLMLRVWLEPGANSPLRVRIVEIVRGLGERSVLATVSVEEACRAVRRWLDAQEDDTQQRGVAPPDSEP